MSAKSNRAIIAKLMEQSAAYYGISDRNNIIKTVLDGTVDDYLEKRKKQSEKTDGKAPNLPSDIDALIDSLIQGTDGSLMMSTFTTQVGEKVKTLNGFIQDIEKFYAGDDATDTASVLHEAIKNGYLFKCYGNWQGTAGSGTAAFPIIFSKDYPITDIIYAGGAGTVPDADSWVGEGTPTNPYVSIISMIDDIVCRAVQDVGLVQLFAAGIPSVNLAKAVPFLDVRIIDKKNDSTFERADGKKMVGEPISAVKFIHGFGDLSDEDTILLDANAKSDVDAAEADKVGGLEVPRSTAGMELFTMPQTFVGANEKYIDLNPDGYTPESKRPNPVLRPFQPLMTITNFKYSVDSADTVMSTLRGTLNITVHDRSRLHEVVPIMRPDKTASLEILVEWGWATDSKQADEDDFFGNLLNACRTKRKFLVSTSTYQFKEDGSVNVVLNMFAKGNDTIALDLVGELGGDSGTTDAAKKLREIAEQVNLFIRKADAENSGIKVQSETIFGHPEALGRFTSIGGMLSIPGGELIKLRKMLLPELIKNKKERAEFSKRYGHFGRAGAFTEVREELKRLIGSDKEPGHIFQYREAIKAAFDKIRAQIEADDTKQDPFRQEWGEISKVFYNNSAQPGKENKDGSGTLGNLVDFNDTNHISLGRLLSIFVLPQLKEKGVWNDIQLLFYPANEDSYGMQKFPSLACFPVNKERFLQKFDTFLESQPNPSMLSFIAMTFDHVENDLACGGYGLGGSFIATLNEEKGVFEYKKAEEKATKKGVLFGYAQRISEASFQIYGTTRKFKKPKIEFDVETLPVEGDETSSILRMHVLDASKDAYSSYSEYLRKLASDSLSILAKNADNIGETDATKAVYNATITARNRQFDRLEKAGFLQKIEIDTDQSAGEHGAAKEFNGAEYYRIAQKPGQIKYFLNKHVPTLKYGTEFGIMKTVGVSANADPALAMIQMQKRLNEGQSGDANASVNDALPLQLFPVSLTVSTIGCPFFRHGQQFFFDFQTNTDIDNIYILTGIDHDISPGKYDTSLKLVRVDKYGFFESLQSTMTELQVAIQDFIERDGKKPPPEVKQK